MKAIVNISPDWGIGFENQLLTHIHGDMRRFRALTLYHTVIFGRKTIDTFPNGDPLPKRNNIVFTHQTNYYKDGLKVCHNLEELKKALQVMQSDEIFVCGGEQIYRLLIPYCEQAYVTLTDLPIKADRFFPNLNRMQNWTLSDPGEWLIEDGIRYRFMVYSNQKIVPM